MRFSWEKSITMPSVEPAAAPGRPVSAARKGPAPIPAASPSAVSRRVGTWVAPVLSVTSSR